jgi:beta-catenin-like protein 1
MRSVDDLFRKPSSSVATGSKRKFPEPPASPSPSSYKSAKVTTNGSPHAPTAEDDDPDAEAGPELPPENEEDEEGRFFGSGVDKGTREAMDYVEGVDGEDAVAEEVIDAAWLRKMAIGFERRITRNAELRSRFDGEPEKYVGLPFLSNFV